jgi:hypothetical protein
MEASIIVAVISGACTLAGSFAGVITSSRLTAYRIQQLELRVDKHNHLVERMYQVEDRLNVQEERLKMLK